MDVKKALSERKSTRAFVDKEVPIEVINTIRKEDPSLFDKDLENYFEFIGKENSQYHFQLPQYWPLFYEQTRFGMTSSHC